MSCPSPNNAVRTQGSLPTGCLPIPERAILLFVDPSEHSGVTRLLRLLGSALDLAALISVLPLQGQKGNKGDHGSPGLPGFLGPRGPQVSRELPGGPGAQLW